MDRGVWYQFGDRSQRMIEELFGIDMGVGAIVSIRDLSRDLYLEYARSYRSLQKKVVLDHQFYIPDFTNPKIQTYPISKYRLKLSTLQQLTDEDISNIATELYADNRDAAADAVLSPAVLYEAGRPDITELNSRLFKAAKQVGNQLGVPTYATVFLSRSATTADQAVDGIISDATSLDADGWYYGFEFERARVPYVTDDVYRCLRAGLTLACTGKPVLHSYAGPMSLLSYAFGATGAAIGHSQNLWHFTRDRWQQSSGQGGGGKTPPRFFSRALWGTIVYPDESSLLPPPLNNKVVLQSQSPFSVPTRSGLDWSKWDANKHLLHVICSETTRIAALGDPRLAASEAINVLSEAQRTFREIAGLRLGVLRDNTDVYQENWRVAVDRLIRDCATDFDYLDLLLG